MINKAIDITATLLETIFKVIIFLAVFLPNSVDYWLPNVGK